MLCFHDRPSRRAFRMSRVTQTVRSTICCRRRASATRPSTASTSTLRVTSASPSGCRSPRSTTSTSTTCWWRRSMAAARSVQRRSVGRRCSCATTRTETRTSKVRGRGAGGGGGHDGLRDAVLSACVRDLVVCVTLCCRPASVTWWFA